MGWEQDYFSVWSICTGLVTAGLQKKILFNSNLYGMHALHIISVRVYTDSWAQYSKAVVKHSALGFNVQSAMVCFLSQNKSIVSPFAQ